MRNRIECKPGAGFDEALAAGYRISKPVSPSKRLKEFCNSLGPEYHLANIDLGDVIHRVVGKGWDVEIFWERAGEYQIVLWKDYGNESVKYMRGIKKEEVQDAVEMLIQMIVSADIHSAV